MNSGGAKKKTKTVKHQNPFDLSIAKKTPKKSTIKKFGMSNLAIALGLDDPKPKKRVKTTPFVYTVDDKVIKRPNYLDIKYNKSYMKEFESLFNRIGISLNEHANADAKEFNVYANNLVEAYDYHYFTIRDKLVEFLKNQPKNEMEMLD
jgi:hypothetical protein